MASKKVEEEGWYWVAPDSKCVGFDGVLVTYVRLRNGKPMIYDETIGEYVALNGNSLFDGPLTNPFEGNKNVSQ